MSGPNSKKRSRAQYVKYRLNILHECCIRPPSKEEIERMMDENEMTEIQIDAIFKRCIHESSRR